jgi:hypothetical protein
MYLPSFIVGELSGLIQKSVDGMQELNVADFTIPR